MTPGRMEAFSDGVIAILITVMVLELHIPKGPHWSDVREQVPVLLAYLLSFVYLGIYWTNHHHMIKATRQVNGAILWANLHLLFWLSLVPAATNWMSHEDFATVPVALYGMMLLAAGTSYYILQTVIIRSQQPDSVLARAIGRDLKGKASPLLYGASIGLAFVDRWLAVAIYTVVALMWLVPDRRVANTLSAVGQEPGMVGPISRPGGSP